MSEIIDVVPRLRHLAALGPSPEALLGAALVEVMRCVLKDELQVRLEAAKSPPKAPWMTPPAAARVSGVPVKSIRAWARSGRIQKRLKNRSADPKQQKYLVNIDDVVAVAEDRGAPVADGGDADERVHSRAQEILAARAARGR